MCLEYIWVSEEDVGFKIDTFIKTSPDRIFMRLTLTTPEDCLCDFTYNFIWQHKGADLDPDAVIPHQQGTDYTYCQLVETLASGGDVHISGSVGKRFASGLGFCFR